MSTEARLMAWETRRTKYGPKGHGGYSPRHKPDMRDISNIDAHGMFRLIIRLHVEGKLTEGQVAHATGLNRRVIRTYAQDGFDERDAP